MNHKCCYVPMCTGSEGSSLHRLPKKRPEVAINLLRGLGFPDDYKPPETFRICSAHFTDDSIGVVNGKARMKTNPTLKSPCEGFIFGNDDVGTFIELKKTLPDWLEALSLKGWKMIDSGNKIFIFLQELDDSKGIQVHKNVVINNFKRVTAFVKGSKIKLDERIPRESSGNVYLKKWSDLYLVLGSFTDKTRYDPEQICKDAAGLLDLVQEPEFERKVRILQDQLTRLTCTGESNRKKFSNDTVLMASQLYKISSACYKSLGSYLSLPHKATLHRYIPNRIKRYNEKKQPASAEGCMCTSCGLNFKFESELELHEYFHSDIVKKLSDEEALVGCSICIFKSISEAGVIRHLEDHRAKVEKEKEINCLRCNTLIKNFDHLLEHQKIHMSRKNYKCSICSRVYTYGDILLKHIRQHVTNRCSICHSNKTFKTPEELTEHLSSVHSGNNSNHLCPTCGSSFPTASKLSSHMECHDTEANYLCSVDGCNKRFYKKHNLRVHLSVHQEASYYCTHCDKVLKTLRSLQRHEQIKHEQKEMECE